MIQFFRHIRQTLIMENKTSKYFKYAIGEIILVVIGILIALQINNWNQERSNSLKEKQYLNNLKQDFKNQIIEINDQIIYEKKFLKNAKHILNSFNLQNNIRVDSLLVSSANALNDRRTFNAVNPTYTELLNTGDMKLINNETFKNELIVYQQDLERLAEVIKLNNSSFVDREFGPKIRDLVPYNFSFMNVKGFNTIDSLNYQGGISEKNLEILTNVTALLFEDNNRVMQFMNQVATRYDYAWYHIKLMNDKKNETKKLLDLLKRLIP
jgi:hypothetical protein